MWLDDTIINAAQTLLKKQLPNIDGFQYTLCAAPNKLDVLSGEAIQIMHTHTNHWACTYIEKEKASVRLYDSLYSSIPTKTVDQIIELVHPMSERVSIKSMVMQQQRGSSNCGLFAIAVATALCNHHVRVIVLRA